MLGRRHILTLLRREKRLLVRFVLTSVGRSALAMSAILLIREFLAGVLGGGSGLAATVAEEYGNHVALSAVAVLLLASYVGASLLNYDNRVVQQRIIKLLELGMWERLLRHLLSLSVPFFDRQSEGDIIQAVRQDVTNLRVASLSLARIFLDGTLALGLFASALWLSRSLTLWALIVLPAAVFPIYLIARRTLQKSYSVRKAGYVLFDLILQMLHGIRIIKAYRGEEEEARSAVEKGRLYFDELIEMVRIRSLSEVALESLAGLGIVVVVIVGGIQVMNGVLEWPTLLAFLMAIRALHGPLNSVNTSYVEIKRHGAAVQRIDEIMATKPDVPDLPDASPLPSSPRKIRLEDVCFAYSDHDVLRDISFEVGAGETIGIVGPSGAGKTTLLNLLARFYDPKSGRVLYDEHDVRTLRLADIYDKLAIVTQQPFLFASSIRDNIGCGRPGASDGDLVAAAKAAEIHDDIVAMPEGYDTMIGVGGRGLSVGQAQRLNIARAILKNAPILLLDEATSSLDSVSESKVQRAIDRLMEGRTTFAVAHRLSTLRNSDWLLVLEAGECVGRGSHEELMAECDVYRRMWQTQQMTEQPAKREPHPSPHREPLRDPVLWTEETRID